MDKLERIFALQRQFDEDLARRRGLTYRPEVWVQKEVLAMLSELAELLDEVNFRWWKDPRPIDREKVLEELVDLLHFFISTCLKMGFEAEDLYEAYVRKNRENFKRQEGLTEREGYKS
ncbi:MAG: dUTPase [Bacillota bacterium]